MKKYILLIPILLSLLSIFCGNKPTAPTSNFVTFTALQSMGLTLKSGMSAVTSNDFARKRSIDSLYAVDDSYYAFASLGANDFVISDAIQAPSLNQLGGSGLIYSEAGGYGWAACGSVNMTPIDPLGNAWYTDGTATPESGDHLYANNSGTTNTDLPNNYWFFFAWDGIYRYVQVTNDGTNTTIVYSGISCPSSGTNVGITSSEGAITGVNEIDVWAYATQAVNTPVTVNVHIQGNTGSADVDVVIPTGYTSGMTHIHLGSGTLVSIIDCYINSLTPTSYSGFNYNF